MLLPTMLFLSAPLPSPSSSVFSRQLPTLTSHANVDSCLSSLPVKTELPLKRSLPTGNITLFEFRNRPTKHQAIDDINVYLLIVCRAMDLSPGSEHKIFFQIADSGLGVIQALHIYWVSRHNVSSPAENTRRHVLYFDGDFQLTSEDGQVTTHHPVQQHLEERFQLLAYPIRTNSTSTSLPPSYSAQP